MPWSLAACDTETPSSFTRRMISALTSFAIRCPFLLLMTQWYFFSTFVSKLSYPGQILIFITALAAGLAGYFWIVAKKVIIEDDVIPPQACTEEAMQCPDG